VCVSVCVFGGGGIGVCIVVCGGEGGKIYVWKSKGERDQV
jgi:hypothetical protein